MNDLLVGQVLSLRIRFNNTGTVSKSKHPYLIVAINEDLGYVEIAQLDSLSGKEYKAAMRCNKTIFADEPTETVIDKDSYIQLDNTFKIELFADAVRYRRQADTLSAGKLADVLNAYQSYRVMYEIDDNKIVFMEQAELESLNR